MVGGMNVAEELRSKLSEEIIDDRQVYGRMMESMTGYTIVKFRMPKGMSTSGAWMELRKHYTPKTL